MSQTHQNPHQELQPVINPGEALVFHPSAVRHLGRLASGDVMPIAPNADFEDAYRDSANAKREQLLSLEQNREGINFDRIDEYRKKMGAPNKAILFLDPENYAKAQAIVGNVGGDEGGLYDPLHDVAIVRRDPETEELNGVAYTEAAAVHEIAHATAEIITTGLMVETHTTGLFKKKKTVTLQPTLTRAGFAVVHQEDAHGDMHGLFLEEGYAGYEQGEYIRELGNESGAVSDNPVLLSDANRYKGTPLERFATIIKDATGQLKIAAGMRQSVPAVTLEQLFNHDPELLPLIRESRGSVDALREVPKRINAIMPGLYQRMQGINMKAPDGVDQAAHLMVEVVQHLDGLSKAGTEPESIAA